MDNRPSESDVTRDARRSSGASRSDGAFSRAVIISSVHDYRSRRRGSIQAIADAWARRGIDVSFVSIRFSPLSLLKRDSRTFLWRKANRTEQRDGVKCFIWATPFHPFATKSVSGDNATERLHDLYARWPNKALDRLIGEADVVLIESGLGIALVPRIRDLNRNCLLIYRGSDALDTIGAHPHLATLLEQYVDEIDQFCLLSPQMAPPFMAARERTFCVPQGIEISQYEAIGESPYSSGRHVASVGSMLFDRTVFDIAAEAFPELTFHIIGSGDTWRCARNVVLYPEMKFLETLPYVAHAEIGVAPYRQVAHCHYLADSSMKLAQYSYLRRPAVCPHFAVGTHPHRFGYTPGDAKEIVTAFSAALKDRFSESAPTPKSWDELAARMLNPHEHDDVWIPDAFFEGAAIRNGAVGPPFAADRQAAASQEARC